MEEWLMKSIQSEKFKSGAMAVLFLTPLNAKTAALNALVPSVLLRGTANYPDMEAVANRLSELYGATAFPYVGSQIETQFTGVWSSCPDDRYIAGSDKPLEPLLDFVDELLNKAVLSDEYILSEKQNLVDNIKAQMNNKGSYAGIRLGQEMFGDEPFAVIATGSLETAEAITPDALRAHFEQLKQTARREIVYVGASSYKFTKIADRLNANGSVPLAPVAKHIAPAKVKEVTEQLDVTQGRLGLGFTLDGESNSRAALSVFNAVFGGTPSSKLFMNVREKLSLCYSVNTAVNKPKGIMLSNAGIDFVKRDDAQGEILRQLDAVKRGEFTAAELTDAKLWLIKSLQGIDDNASSMVWFEFERVIVPGTKSVAEQIADLQAVTAEDVYKAAQSVQLDTVYWLEGESK
jgi:predicted Zn-dependent peptidase